MIVVFGICYMLWLLFSVTAFASKVIMLSFDGFRWDYLDERRNLTNFERLRNAGFRLKNLKNAFATVTLPNHYSIVTGKWEDEHGIVENHMWDPVLNESFRLDNHSSHWFDAEPIWVTAKRHGLTTACINWVGCDVPINGQHPDKWLPYNKSLPFNERLDTLLGWISNGRDLGLAYFEEPDLTGHINGTDSAELNSTLRMLDDLLGTLLDRVDLNLINVIVTSDHGMVDIDPNTNVRYLDKVLSGEYNISSDGANAHVWVEDKDKNETLNSLEKLANVTCREKSELHADLHYTNNRRIAPIICSAELGVVLKESSKMNFTGRGEHGYDPTDESSPMRPIFLAAGPNLVRRGSKAKDLPPMDIIQVYPLIAKLLDFHVNMSTAGIHHLLSSPSFDADFVVA